MGAKATDTAQFIAEFVGTFMLVFTVGCNVIVGSPVWGATSIACVLMVCIYALGDISGANFNPAVSVALGITKKMDFLKGDEETEANRWKKVGIYCAVQIVAGILAGVCYSLLLGKAFNLAPATGYGMLEVGLAEILYTFMLCFVVLNVAASKSHGGKNEFYGIAIGFVIVAGGYAVGHMGAGCFNPAVAFGIDVSSALHGFGWCIYYTICELIGAAVAAVLFSVCREEENDESNKDGLAGDERSNVAKLLSEFLGTYILVLTVGLNVLGGSQAAVWSIAASLMCMIFALGSVSGAHFNPAVTLAFHLRHTEKINVTEMVSYMGAQLVGGILASFTWVGMEHGKSIALKPSGSMFQAWVAEFVFTFLLAFVVLSAACRVDKPLTQHFGLIIGSCVTVGGFAIGAVSGGSLNPAVTAGLDVTRVAMTGETVQLMHLACYVVFELLGGAAAAGVFNLTRQGTIEYKNDV